MEGRALVHNDHQLYTNGAPSYLRVHRVRALVREYHHLYGLTKTRLDRAGKDALVMHPGPMNRGVEIDSEVADMIDRSIITRQVEMGVAIRMAALDVLTRRARGVDGWGEAA